MPQYTYYCPKCNKDITINRKMSEYTSTIVCDDCLEEITRKPNDLVCGLSVDKTGDFYRSVN